MRNELDDILKVLNLVLIDRATALEFVSKELSFANRSSLVVRNFAKLSGIKIKEEMPILDLDSPNILLSNLLSSSGTFQSTIELRLKIIDEIMKIHELGNYSNVDDKDVIKAICKERGIKELIHFTKIENVRSILDIGLNSKDYNGEVAKKHKINDRERFDYRTHMISLSISYPNDKMFYRNRINDRCQEWAVLRLSPSILWELDCLFCPLNAASAAISSANDDELSGSHALQQMFNKQTGNLRACDPTDSQAEILVNSHIPTKYIESVVLEKETKTILDTSFNINFDSGYFHNRDYALKYYFS
ncbi:MAG: DarT ssDNA thymidine ADP-ribosyltransferase family protein [Paraglaciecola sp.]